MSARTVHGVDAVLEQIAAHRSTVDPERRLLIAIAGPPGAGKSTLAEALHERMAHSQIVPMDGFHLDNRLLDSLGLRAVKGAPETFDVHGFHALLERIARDDGPVHIPVFDRDADLSRAAAATVLPTHRTLLIEGNYLLLDEAPWSSLAGFFDFTLALQVPQEMLEQRLVDRWLEQGMDPQAARQRALSNDIPNGKRVLTGSRQPNVFYPSDGGVR